MASKTLKASILIGGAITGAFRSALSTTKDGLKRIGEEIANVERRQRLLGRSIHTFGRMGKSVEGLRAQYAALTRQADKLRAAQQRLARVHARIEANATRRQALGGKLRSAVGGAVALALPVGSMLGSAARFQHANQLIGNTAKLSAAELKALGAAMLQASKDTNQSATDVQRAIVLLVAAGMDVHTAKASIRAIGRTASASGADIEDLSRASFTLTDSLNIQPKGLQSALDILILAGQQGSFELRDMAKTLPVLGSSFRALKMQGAEAAATMGAALQIAYKGAGDADEAANNMRNFMAKLLSPGTLKKAQDKFGLDLYAVIASAQNNGGNPFEAAMTSIMQATAGDQKKIGELFQDMQVQNFLRPMIQNWDDYQRIKDQALNHSKGKTDRDFEKMMDTAKEQMKSVRNAAGRFGVIFGHTLTPSIGAASEKMARFLEVASGFVDKHPKLVGGLIKTALALTGLRLASLALGYAWTLAMSPVLSIMGFIARWRAAGAVSAMGRFGAATMRIAGIVRTLGLAIAAIGVGPIALIVGALVIGAVVVRKYWEPIKAFFSGVWNGFSQAVTAALAPMIAAFAPLKPLWDGLIGWIGQAWDGLMKLLQPIASTENELKKAAKLGERFGVALSLGCQLATTVMTGVAETLVRLGTAIGETAGWIVVHFGKATAGFSHQWDAAIAGVQRRWDGLKAKITQVAGWIMQKLQPIFAAMRWVSKLGTKLGAKAMQLGRVTLPHPQWNAQLGQPWVAPVSVAKRRHPPPVARHAAVGRAAGSAFVTQKNPSVRMLGPRLPTTPAVAPRPRQAPPMPAPARRSDARVNVTQQNTFHITQRPGESSEALAQRIARHLQHREGIARRGSLIDEAA